MPIPPEVSARYHFGTFELEVRSGELRRNGVKLKLQEQPFQVLVKLLEHAGEVVAREELRSALWTEDTFVDFETGLNTAIRRLREALGDSADNPIFIETVPKRGYRFIATVSRDDSQPRPVRKTIVSGSRNTLGTALQVGCVLVLAAVLAGFSLKHFAAADLRRDKTLDFAQLTNDGQMKIGPVLSDGSRVYFSEVLPTGEFIGQVSASGGETVPIATSLRHVRLLDLSPDGTELLVLSGGEQQVKEEKRGIALWIVPVAGGSARPVGDVKAISAVWTPDGKSILFADGHDIFTVGIDGSNRRKLLSVSGYPDYFRWSPDGQRLRFTLIIQPMYFASSLWEVRADGKDLHPVLPEQANTTVCCGVWARPGRDFLYQSFTAGRTDLWELDGRRRLFGSNPVRLTSGPMDFSWPATSQVPNVVFALGTLPRGELVKYREETAEFEPYLSGISAEGVASSRDGKWVTYTSFPEGTLWRSDSSGAQKLQLTFPPMRAYMPRWSPDGNEISFIGSTRNDHWTTYVISSNGGVARQLVPGDSQIADAMWLPDGKSVVYGPWKGGGLKGVYQLDLVTQRATAVPGGQEMWSPRVSPDGRYIAAMTWVENKMMVLDRTTGKWEQVSPSDSSYTGYPSWSHDSKLLYFQEWSNGTFFPSSVMRVRISDRKLETVLDFQRVSRLPIGSFVTWSGLASDDSVLLARNISSQEIYSLRW